MEYPPVWDFRPYADFPTHEPSFAQLRPLGLEVTLQFDRLAAGRVQLHTAGTQLLRAHFPAESILGPEFTGICADWVNDDRFRYLCDNNFSSPNRA